MSNPTQNNRTDAKNKLGLSGTSPVDPAFAELLPRSGATNQRAMDIGVGGGTPVRTTHPGIIGKITKEAGVFAVEVVATEGSLDRETRRQAPFTKYSNLGTLDVVENERVTVGQELGTVAFRSVSGVTGMSYQVFKNGTGTAAAEAFPESAEGIAIVKTANPSGIAPDSKEQLRKAPAEAGAESDKLAPEDGAASTSNLPTDGPRTSNFPYSSRPQVAFVEQKNQVFTHDFLVFIDGVDVTKYIVGQVDISLVDKDGWNEAGITLNNAADNFVITYDNLGINATGKPKFRDADIAGEDKYSERAKREIMNYKNDTKLNPFVDVPSMSIVQAGSSQGLVQGQNFTGFTQTAEGAQSTDIADTSRQESGQRTVGGQESADQLDRRWQLGYQSTVFHKNDPIRIFRKNPLREADEWMPAFTGYLENISYDTNYVTGTSNVKLTCYDIRALISKMRVQTTAVTGVTNPRAIFLARPDSGVDSLFSDLLDPSINAHPLSGRRFEDVMEFLTTGLSTQDPKLTTRFRDSGFSRGVGDFTVGDKIYYKPGDTATGEQPDPLEHWHALCLFGMDGSTVLSGDSIIGPVKRQKGKTILGAPMNRRWLTQAEARKIGSETTHDGQWAPHSMFVHFLLPQDGTGAQNLLEFDALNANSNQLEFRGLLDIMQDFCNRIDYQFWVSPMGDIIIEFPQYDFFPRDYGEFETVFRVNKHLQSDNVQDEAGDMTTAIIAHGRIVAFNEGQIEDQFQPKAVVVAPLMMIRYGVLEHELTLPFISDSNSLNRIAQIEFQKKLAESNRMDMQFDYRPFITPNRPMENFERQRMALTTAVQNSLELFQTGSTSISTRYVRRALSRSDGSIGYTLITGGTSMPISYRQIFLPGTTSPGSQQGTGGAEQLLAVPSGNSEVNPSSTSGTGATVAEPIMTPGNQGVIAAINNCVEEEFGFTPQQTGIFKALGQQMSGFTESARNNETGGFGIFQLRQDVRGDDIEGGAFGIGDTTDVNTQISSAGQYFDGLWDKYSEIAAAGGVGAGLAGVGSEIGGDAADLATAVGNGTVSVGKAVIAEFSLGAEKIKNIDVVEEFNNGWGAVTEELGEKWEELSQSVKDGWDVLFPGEESPVDTQTAASSEETKEATAEAEAEGSVPSDPGYQSTVGVLVYDNAAELLRASKESLQETQERQAAEKKLREEQAGVA